MGGGSSTQIIDNNITNSISSNVVFSNTMTSSTFSENSQILVIKNVDNCSIYDINFNMDTSVKTISQMVTQNSNTLSSQMSTQLQNAMSQANDAMGNLSKMFDGDSDQDITNNVNNIIQNHFTSTNSSKCYNSFDNSQKLIIDGCKDSSIHDISFTMTAQFIAACSAQSTNSNNISDLMDTKITNSQSITNTLLNLFGNKGPGAIAGGSIFSIIIVIIIGVIAYNLLSGKKSTGDTSNLGNIDTSNLGNIDTSKIFGNKGSSVGEELGSSTSGLGEELGSSATTGLAEEGLETAAETALGGFRSFKLNKYLKKIIN